MAKKFDADKLEIQLDPRGPDRWKWIVAEKGRAPLESATVTGSRSHAYGIAADALARWQRKGGS